MKDKLCFNCKYFIRHYAWCGQCFSKLDCGHCVKRKYRKQFYKRFPLENGCAYWEDGYAETAEKNKHFEAELQNISKRVYNLLMLLKSENE